MGRDEREGKRREGEGREGKGRERKGIATVWYDMATILMYTT